MRVLTIFAHHNPRAFCRAVLDQFSAGVSAAGHTHEIVDLYAIGWNPVFSDRDSPNWVDETVPDDVLEYMHLEQSLREAAATPVQRLMLKRFTAGLDARGILRKIHARGGPRDVAEQQAKLARADALVLISPVHFMGFPAILKGWIDRVLCLGFAFGFKAEAWRGDVTGRLPLLTTKKALIINTTIFDEATYDAGHRAAMKTLIDDYCLRYPGIAEVHHEYFYAVHGADDATRRNYLDRAYQLGRELFPPDASARPPTLDATPATARRLARRSLTNLSKMGHCAPSVMQGMLDVAELRQEWLVKLCAGLPGGIGNTGNECGGITASLVLLGLRHAHEPEVQGLPSVIYKGHDLYRRFEACHGSSRCAQLRGTARLPLGCADVVRRAPAHCAASMCADCSGALPTSAREAFATLHAHLRERDFHCADSVMQALGDRVASPGAALRDATSAFVGGTLFRGETCSALSAGVMALGLIEGVREDSRLRVARMLTRMALGSDALSSELNAFSRVMNRGQELAHWFEREYGSTQCRTLTGRNFAEPAEVAQYIESGAISRCQAIALAVAERVRTMTQEPPARSVQEPTGANALPTPPPQACRSGSRA